MSIITSLSQGVLFVLGRFIDFLQGAIGVTDRVPVTLARKALGAPVPKTPVELVHGGTMSDRIAGIVPVHQVPVRHTHFTSVSDRTDTIARGRMLLSQLVFLPRQPFQGFMGLIGPGSMPSTRWFRGNLAFGN